MACQKKSDENEKTVIELVHLICFESVFMYVDAELNFSFFVLLGNDEFAVTVREGVDTVQDIFEQKKSLTDRSTAETLSEREGVVGGY